MRIIHGTVVEYVVTVKMHGLILHRAAHHHNAYSVTFIPHCIFCMCSSDFLSHTCHISCLTVFLSSSWRVGIAPFFLGYTLKNIVIAWKPDWGEGLIMKYCNFCVKTISASPRFERLSEECMKNIETLKNAHAKGQPVPKCRTEERTVNAVKWAINSDYR